MTTHYDLAASEAAARYAEADAYRQAFEGNDDPQNRAFVEMQHRLRDTAILPVLDAMRAANEGETSDLAVGALASTVAVALANIAELTSQPVSEILAFFDTVRSRTIEALTDGNGCRDIDVRTEFEVFETTVGRA